MEVTQWEPIYNAKDQWYRLPTSVGDFYSWVEAEAGVKILDWMTVRIVDPNRYTLFLIKYSK